METVLYRKNLFILVIRSFDFSLLDLVGEVFRDILENDYKLVNASPKPIEDEVVIKFWYNPEEVRFQ